MSITCQHGKDPSACDVCKQELRDMLSSDKDRLKDLEDQFSRWKEQELRDMLSSDKDRLKEDLEDQFSRWKEKLDLG